MSLLTVSNEQFDKNGKRTSAMWSFFSPISKTMAKCNICDKDVSFKSTTTNLKKHLMRKHVAIAVRPGDECKAMKIAVESGEWAENEDDIKDTEAVDDIEEETEFDQISNDNPLKSTGVQKAEKISSFRKNSNKIFTRPLKCTKLVTPGIYQQKTEVDEFSVFGEYVSVQLKQLPLETALRVQNQIHNLITQARLNSLEANSKM